MMVLTILTRIPFRARIPTNWDAVQYILALRQFDIAAHQPHPPGNPLYVLLGRGVNQLIADPNQALIAVSIVASVVTVWGTALLGARLVNRRVGAWAALLLAVNPLFWFYGETALAYVPEAAVGVVVALAAWHAYQRPTWSRLILLSASTAVAGGLRPTVLPLLVLVWLFGIWRFSWRGRIAAAVATGIGCLAWLVPLLVVSGGPVAYWTQLQRLTEGTVQPTSLANGPSWAWLSNVGSVLAASAIMLNLFGVILFRALRRRPALDWLEPGTLLLAAWIIPPVLMFTLVHFGHWGYLLLILPPVLILGLMAVEQAGMLVRHAGARVLMPAAGASLALFLLVPPLPFMRGHDQPTRPALQAHDAAWREVTQRISALPPEETVVITSSDGRESYRLAGYTLPSYQVMGIGHDWHGSWGSLYEALDGQWDYQLNPNMTAHWVVPMLNVRYLAVLDESLIGKMRDDMGWTDVSLPDGNRLLIRRLPQETAYVSFTGGEFLVLTSSQFQAFRAQLFEPRD